MTCTNCGSNSPCSCSQQRACDTICSCGNPSCGGDCGCGTPLPATPTPFYACAPVCPESHTQTLVVQNFYYDIAAQNTWNIPNCGETAVLFVPGLKSIAIGAYIWSSEFGYLEVTAFNASTNQLTVKNNCNAGNAGPGTNVPACSKFTVSDPPADNSETTDSCVAIDFTAPADTVCIPITLTNLDSIQVSDEIQIGAGRYRVQSIDGPNIITICNDGLGLVAGTAVIAQDPAGNYQYCITLVSTCCARIEEEFGGDLTPCSNFENLVVTQNEGEFIPGAETIGDTETGNTSSIVVEFDNTSECRTMKGTLTVTFGFTLGYLGTTGINTVSIAISESVDGGLPGAAYVVEEGWAGDPGIAVALARTYVFTREFTVTPGISTTFAYQGSVSLSATGDGEVVFSQVSMHVTGMAVAA